MVVSQVGNRIRVDVRDNGPGIPTAAPLPAVRALLPGQSPAGDGVGLAWPSSRASPSFTERISTSTTGPGGSK